MTSVNYIRHLSAVFQLFSKDSRLHPTHISLYVTLFQYWNINRFPEIFYINREEVMKMAKIGSLKTYHRCLRGLDDWKYISYIPSHNIYKGSQIRMLRFETTSDTTSETTSETMSETPSETPSETTSGTSSETTSETNLKQPVEQPLKHNINNNKHDLKKNKQGLPENEFEVLEYFKKENVPVVEGSKFFNHYNSVGWKLGGKMKIVNWQSLAKKWILNVELLAGEESVFPKDNLKTTKNKNYDEPL